MNVIPTEIPGCYRIEPSRHEDARGYFSTVFDLGAARRLDPAFDVRRLNRSLTRPKGAIRGLHYQRPPAAEDKIVQCVAGRVFDVCVDLRSESATYRQWIASELAADAPQLLWIPKGCAHGFQTLTDDCLIEYLTTGDYAPEHERGVRWNDPMLAIDWPLPCTLTSEKDAAWPLLSS